MNTSSPHRHPDDTEWAKIVANDPDGAFIYAVVTTGGACRPACRSRRPNRENVRTFDTLAAAEAAGFRACKRCRPI